MKSFEKAFFWTYLSPKDSGLSVETYVSIRITNRRPVVLIGEHGRNASMLIDDNPRLLSGHLDKDVKKEISDWIKIN